MDKEDARFQTLERLHERRKQVVRLHRKGIGVMRTVELSGLSYPTVRGIIDRYEQGGAGTIKPTPRGRQGGEGRHLTDEQERLVRQIICDKRPEQLKMEFALWNRAAVMQLIGRECGIKLSVRGVGNYLKRWGFTPQKPIKKAYEQRPEAVQNWLEEEYPTIEKRAKAEGAEIHWGDETAVVNTDVRGRSYAPAGKTPVTFAVGCTRQKLSMIATVTNQGKTRWMIIDEAFNSDKLIEFLEALIKDAAKKVFLILDNLRVHHSKPVKAWVVPVLGLDSGCYWIIDDTGFPKKGKHSVGVARQYCGQLGKQDNCQVAVSLSLASVKGSIPIAYQLYLPKDWADDMERRKKGGVPEDIVFATKPEIALEQMRQAIAAGVPLGVVLTDAGYGDETAFRDGITEMGMLYAVGIRPATTVWAPGTAPLPPKAWSGHGIRPTRLRRESGNEPVAVKALALALPKKAWRTVTWREGSNSELSSRFAAVRVRPAHRDYLRPEMRPEEWLLIEWPEDEAEPIKYFLTTAPIYATLDQMVFVTKVRWRIERDYQDLKQDFGLSHYEGRSWRGFHHHATLSIAAYGFLMAQRLKAGRDGGGKKNFAERQVPAIPKDYVPRGRPARTTSRNGLDHDTTPALKRRAREHLGPLPALQLGESKITFVTQ